MSRNHLVQLPEVLDPIVLGKYLIAFNFYHSCLKGFQQEMLFIFAVGFLGKNGLNPDLPSWYPTTLLLAFNCRKSSTMGKNRSSKSIIIQTIRSIPRHLQCNWKKYCNKAPKSYKQSKEKGARRGKVIQNKRLLSLLFPSLKQLVPIWVGAPI